MIKVSVFYPNQTGARFDFDYYTQSHLPMVRDKLGEACKGVAAEKGLAGGAPDAPAPYVAIAHLYFESVEAFNDAFGPVANDILGDIPNYTDLAPQLQISEVLVNASRSETGALHSHG
ncbi:EthD family reductase [Nitrogeniibacter mangrovi]|uniref:EthD family reductase n=1 Tax=Nitrogeniibacter mangrovi TaxID=2016596 RepID=A0A6C1AZN6_9RHOO|nr:EthD family reductase [Nitrogeniibacter mangrovi]QID16593.1 EthD family reductase [Nitrogeniibacter mangrovi]